jgi:hypothetical protein
MWNFTLRTNKRKVTFIIGGGERGENIKPFGWSPSISNVHIKENTSHIRVWQ